MRKILAGETGGNAVEKLLFSFRTSTSSSCDSDVGYSDAEPGSVAIIDIRSVLTRYDTWCDYGAETYREAILQALNTDNIAAIILALDTPGGATSAMNALEGVIRSATKPIVAYVDDMAFSAGYFIAAIATKIVAAHPMAEVGSIGVMATLYDYREADKKFGVKVLSIYPPESSFKNRSYREAIDEKPEALIKEQLSPYARYFQDAVKAARPALDLSVEGIIEGKEFYAKDAKAYGLIDEIMPLDEVIMYALDLAKMQSILTM